VKIAADALEAVKQHAAEGYPHEICGFLVGPRRGGKITHSVRARNTVVDRARDRYEIVRSCALAPLLDLDPQAAKGLADMLRERLRRHRPDIPGRRRDDEAEATQIIWALARLQAGEALRELRVYMERPDSDPHNVRLASAISTYLDEGEEGVARRVLAHDHEYVLPLCQVSWRCCSGAEVWHAMRSLYRSSELDARCRVITAVFLGARSVATSIAEHPFWRLPLPDVDFPRQ